MLDNLLIVLTLVALGVIILFVAPEVIEAYERTLDLISAP